MRLDHLLSTESPATAGFHRPADAALPLVVVLYSVGKVPSVFPHSEATFFAYLDDADPPASSGIVPHGAQAAGAGPGGASWPGPRVASARRAESDAGVPGGTVEAGETGG